MGLNTDLRPDWDTYFLLIAQAVGMRGECTRRKVGAIVVKDRRIVSTGYNGAPAGDPNCLQGYCPRGQLSAEELPPYSDYETGPGQCIAIHAEANAVIHGDHHDMRDGTMYLTTEPCHACMKLIRGVGIVMVITPTIKLDLTSRLSDYLRSAGDSGTSTE